MLFVFLFRLVVVGLITLCKFISPMNVNEQASEQTTSLDLTRNATCVALQIQPGPSHSFEAYSIF